MSILSDWIRWEASCRTRRGSGITAGDTMHCGLGEYDSLRPCPNGIPIDKRLPGDAEWWRERVERARRDIEKHQAAIAMNELGNGAVFVSEDVSRLVDLTGSILDDNQ